MSMKDTDTLVKHVGCGTVDDMNCCPLCALIRARLRDAAPRVEGWRPIATAPKDGTRILLCLKGGARLIGRWSDEAEFGQFTVRPGWQIFDCDDCFYSRAEDDEVAHWMSLPAPPKTPSHGKERR